MIIARPSLLAPTQCFLEKSGPEFKMTFLTQAMYVESIPKFGLLVTTAGQEDGGIFSTC